MKTLLCSGAAKRLRSASFTVELAMLMPVLIFTVFSCVYLDFHLHNYAALTARAAEMAITGKKEGEAVLFGENAPEADVREERGKRLVTFELVSPSFTDPTEWRREIRAEHKLTHPVKYLRGLRALREAGGDGESGT